MKTNCGTYDRIIRAVVGFAIMASAFSLEGAWELLGLLGLVLALSAYFGYCPVYHLFHVDTTGHHPDGLDLHA